MCLLKHFLVAAPYADIQISYHLLTQYPIIGKLDCFLCLVLAIIFKCHHEHPKRYVFVCIVMTLWDRLASAGIARCA